MKKIIVINLVIFLCPILFAQETLVSSFCSSSATHNISFEIEGGIGSLLINGSEGGTKSGVGFGGILGYTCMFGPVSGIHTGIGFSYANSSFKSETVSSSYEDRGIMLHDAFGSFAGNVQVTTTTYRVDEIYNAAILTIPIQYAFRYRNFWANIGLRLSMPLTINSTYAYGPSTASITYFSLPDVDFSSTPIPYHEIDAETQTGNYKAEKSMFFIDLAFEGGYQFCLNPVKELSLFVGLYIDYAFNRVSGGESGFLEFDGVELYAEPRFQCILNSKVVSNFNRFAAGLKVCFNMGLGMKYATSAGSAS